MNWFIKLFKNALQFMMGKSPRTPQSASDLASGTSSGQLKNPSTSEGKKAESQVLESSSGKKVVEEQTNGSKTKSTPHIKPPTTTPEETVLSSPSSTSKGAAQRIDIQKNPSKTSITGTLNDSLLTTQKLVNYEPNTKFKKNVPQTFPLVLMPAKNTVIKPPVNGKSSNKGMTEESFCRDFLMNHFKNLVYDSLTVFIGSTPYEPDLAFIDLVSGKNIFIDIEIDEPYDGISRNPTHYRKTLGGTADDNRNQGFTDRGWMVIRFAEEQIVSSPNECVKFIGEVIKSVNPSFTSACLDFQVSLKSISMWTEAEAKVFAAEEKREKYLGISEFFASGGPRDYKITDSTMGKDIEEKINQNMVINSTILDRIKIASQPISPVSVFQSKPEVQKESPTPIALNVPTTPAPTLAKLIPPAIILSSAKLAEPKLTTKTEKPSQPSPQPYANQK